MSWFIDNPAGDLIIFKIVFNWISLFNIWVWESNGSWIVSDDVWNLVWSNSFFNNFSKFEVSFWAFNADEGESSFFIIQKSIVLSSFNKGNDIHNTDWEFMISSDFVINFETCLFILSNDGDLFTVSC